MVRQIMQLDLLSYEPPPEEQGDPPLEPLPLEPEPRPNPHALDWQQTKADFYLRVMGRLMDGSLCPQSVRSHEIERLHNLRQQCLKQIKELSQ